MLEDLITQKETELGALKEKYASLIDALDAGCPHICQACEITRQSTQSDVTALSQKINDLDQTIKELRLL